MAGTWINAMIVIKEMIAEMNKSGRSLDEEERIRRITRDVMKESANASASEREILKHMMQSLQQDRTKHKAELQAAAQERDQYKAKMEELNQRMDQLMRDKEARPSGEEDQGLTARQKRLAELWEELKEMRQSKRSDQTTHGKPFVRGGERGRGAARGARKPWYQLQSEGASSQFGRQNKDGTSFPPGQRPSQGRDLQEFEMVYHEDCKSSGFQRKPFLQDNKYQEGQTPFSKKFPQHGERGRRHFSQHFSNTHGDHGVQSDNGHRKDKSGLELSNRDAVQSVGMQNHPSRGSSQHRGQFHNRGQHQQFRGHWHPHRGQFHQHRGQSQDRTQGQSGPRNPSDEFSSNKLTPEEIDALRSVLKQRETASAECTGNPSMTTSKEQKQWKKPKGARAVLPDHSDSDEEGVFKPSKERQATSGGARDTVFDTVRDLKPVAGSLKKKKKEGKNKSSKNQAAAQQKPEGLSPLEVFTASGFDVSKIEGLNMNDAVSDMILVSKEDGNIVSYHPETVGELVEFKRKYPNAQAIIVKNSEQK